jgi:hypothetical protein
MTPETIQAARRFAETSGGQTLGSRLFDHFAENASDCVEIRGVWPGGDLASRHPMTPEVLIGRSLAMCAHPRAAWHVLSPVKRLLLVGAYFGASYLTALAVLLSLGPRI